MRAATAFSLGTFLKSGGKGERNEHANIIDQTIARRLLDAVISEASPLVRKEVLIAFYLSSDSLIVYPYRF